MKGILKPYYQDMEEKKMKKLVCICMAAMMAFTTLQGCSTASTNSSDDVNDAATGKVVVNIEGTVTAVNGDEVSLGNGKTVIISEETVFVSDPDTNHVVSEEIVIGNFIQGYTKDDPDSGQVIADKIYSNVPVQTGSGKMVINFEGMVTTVEDDRITLENGQVILITDDTVFSVASGIVEGIVLLEGYNIQGYTEDDLNASEVTASRIHIITY